FRCPETATAGPTSFHFELDELIGTTIVEPVHDPARLDATRSGIVGQDLYFSPLVHELANLLRAPIGQDHSGGVVEAPEHDAYLLADLVDENHRPARARDGGGELAQGQRRLARGLRAVDLGDAAARDAADAQRHIERERPPRDDRDLVDYSALTQAHDGALAELAVYGRDGQVEGLLAIALRYFCHG